MSTITINNEKREINREELATLAVNKLPYQMQDDENIERFVNEVSFRMADLEFDGDDIRAMKGSSPEEYYFDACLSYALYNSFEELYDLEDDNEIFEYCGHNTRLVPTADCHIIDSDNDCTIYKFDGDEGYIAEIYDFEGKNYTYNFDHEPTLSEVKENHLKSVEEHERNKNHKKLKPKDIERD